MFVASVVSLVEVNFINHSVMLSTIYACCVATRYVHTSYCSSTVHRAVRQWKTEPLS